MHIKVGMIKILELREKAMNALGDKFNIKDFHSAVLDNGNPPLFIVEQIMLYSRHFHPFLT